MAILTAREAAQPPMPGLYGRKATKATPKYDGLTLNELNELYGDRQHLQHGLPGGDEADSRRERGLRCDITPFYYIRYECTLRKTIQHLDFNERTML